jgi:hypothetical protein
MLVKYVSIDGIPQTFVFFRLVLYVRFVDRSLSFWPLCDLFFFDLRILITPLVSSNWSYIILCEN